MQLQLSGMYQPSGYIEIMRTAGQNWQLPRTVAENLARNTPLCIIATWKQYSKKIQNCVCGLAIGYTVC
jgi:hypothetical protein